MNSRDQFEQAYSEFSGMTLVQIVEQRMLDGSYRLPGISKAWHWWQRGQEAA